MPEKDLHGFLIFGKMCKITSKKLKKCISINKVPPTDFKFTSAGGILYTVSIKSQPLIIFCQKFSRFSLSGIK